MGKDVDGKIYRYKGIIQWEVCMTNKLACKNTYPEPKCNLFTT